MTIAFLIPVASKCEHFNGNTQIPLYKVSIPTTRV